MPTPKGTSLPASASVDQVRAALAGGLGDLNMQPFGLGEGDLADGAPYGSRDAVIAHRVLAAGDDAAAGCAVGHALGRVPRTIRLLQLELNPGQDAVIAVSAKNKGDWTASQVQVRIALVEGSSVAGVRALFVVGG
jgi:hypothetical protein